MPLPFYTSLESHIIRTRQKLDREFLNNLLFNNETTFTRRGVLILETSTYTIMIILTSVCFT